MTKTHERCGECDSYLAGYDAPYCTGPITDTEHDIEQNIAERDSALRRQGAKGENNMSEQKSNKQGKSAGELRYENNAMTAMQDVLDLCPGFASKLIQTKSVLYDDFDVLWSRIRNLSETLINEVEEGGAA